MVKWLIRIGIPLLVASGCVFGDIAFARLLFSHLPADLSWLFWAKLGIGIGIAWLTVGIIFLFVLLSGLVAVALTEEK